MSDPAPSDTTLRDSAVAAVRRLDALGMNRGSTGNVSLRQGQGMLITPTGMGADDLRGEDMVWRGWDGTLRGQWEPSSEWHFHQAIYLARPQLNAIVHTHSVHAAALACLRRPLPSFHLYMHVGQMLCDASTTWNRQAWEVDDIAVRLLAAGRLRDFIVVAVHNSGKKRFAEYYPSKFLAHLPESAKAGLIARGLDGPPRSDAYLRFLVAELKPMIDARYATRPGREDTLLMGSSMGGLISVYALREYPQVFGAAAALSTHWITTFEDNEIFPAAAVAYLRRKLPAPGALQLYMDHGTTELDAQ